MLNILIVDDSSFMRKRIASSVKQAGHRVVGTAKDGAEGFELYRKVSPDLVIMDITMRGIDGIQAARMIREVDPSARILFMSLVTDPHVIEEARSLGIAGFLGKNDHKKLSEIMKGLSNGQGGYHNGKL